MKRYEFTVYLSGSGNTPEDAWENAVNKLFGNVRSFMRTNPFPQVREVDSEEEDE